MKTEDQLLQKAVKKVTSSKKEAMKFLKSAGIMTYKGNVSPKYR